MSMPPYLIHSSNYDYTSEYHRRPLLVVYHVNGRQIPCERAVGWCHDCNSVEDMENIDIPTLRVELSKQLQQISNLQAELTALSSGFLNFMGKRKKKANIRVTLQSKEDRVENINVLISTAMSRSALPRCLRCFGENVEKITFKDDHHIQFEHSCDKTMNWDYCSAIPRFRWDFLKIHLDLEGNPISKAACGHQPQ